MSSQRYENTGYTHHTHKAVAAYDTDSQSEEALHSPENNNSRLRQAINYLTSEGGSNDTALYIDRVQLIDKFIIEQYRTEGYAFDPNLYQQLRSLVHEVQREIKYVTEEESSVLLDDSDITAEEIFQLEALYREDDEAEEEEADEEDSIYVGLSVSPPDSERHHNGYFERRREAERRAFDNLITDETPERYTETSPYMMTGGAGPASSVQSSSTEEDDASKARSLQDQHRHDEPNNEVKIKFDLAEPTKSSAADADPTIYTDILFSTLDDQFDPNEYNSGSRSALLAIFEPVGKLVAKIIGPTPVCCEIEEINEGSNLLEQKEKDDAPHGVLQDVLGESNSNKLAEAYVQDLVSCSSEPSARSPSTSRRTGIINLDISTKRSHKPSTELGSLTPRSSSGSRKTGTTNAEVIPLIRKQRLTTSTCSTNRARIDSTVPKSSLKKFDEYRAAAVKATGSKPTAVKTPQKQNSIGNPLSARTLEHVQVRRSTAGRPAKSSKISEQSPLQSAPYLTSTKRKHSTFSSSNYTPVAKKPKAAPTPKSAVRKQKNVASVKKNFTSVNTPLSQKIQTDVGIATALTGTSQRHRTSKAKRDISVRKPYGITRSGKPFKP